MNLSGTGLVRGALTGLETSFTIAVNRISRRFAGAPNPHALPQRPTFLPPDRGSPMINEPWHYLLVIVILVGAGVLSATLSALETLLLYLKEYRVRTLARTHPRLKPTLRALHQDADEHLTQILALGSTVNLFAGLLAVFLFRESGLMNPERGMFWIEILVLMLVLVILVDLIPKAYAIRKPASVCRLAARPFLVFSPKARRLSRPLTRWVRRTTRRVVPNEIVPRGKMLEEELETMVIIRSESGILTPMESNIIRELLRLSRKTAKDCMTPRVDSFALPYHLEKSLVDEELRAHFDYRVPVYGNSRDTIVGILDVVAYLADPERAIDRHLYTAVYVPETMPALDLFYQHLRHPTDLVLVLDEYGGIEGIVRHSHIVEELMEDSLPQLGHEQEILTLVPGYDYRIRGSARLDELSQLLDVPLETEGLDTIGGLVFKEFARLPAPGETLNMGELRLTVLKTNTTRIEELRLRKLADDTVFPS